MTSSHIAQHLGQWFLTLASMLDARSAPRLACIFIGAILARSKRTVTSWIRAAKLSHEFRPCYNTIAAAGKRTDSIAARLLHGVLKPLLAGLNRLVFALDDTPTPRYGRRVQGAGIHHNPCPGPANNAFLYGHVWVVLGLLVAHPIWGMIALPLLARLYVRKKDLTGIDKEHRPKFATKLELAVELLKWAKGWLEFLGKPLWVVVDGAYAKAAFLKPLIGMGFRVVSRLRKDAALWSVPGERPAGQRGPNRKYGENRIVLSKRASHKDGWQSETFELYGKSVVKRYKTFEATWRPVGGVIRVVLVDEPKGWVAFFCTDQTASVADILGLVSDRFSLETAFRDMKEVVGAGQQQVRCVWASVGSFHVCLWTFTLTEAWAWNQDKARLVGQRSASPWDDQGRRPSHADKRRAWQRELVAKEIEGLLQARVNREEIHQLTERLLDLAA